MSVVFMVDFEVGFGKRSSLHEATRRNGWRHLVRDSRGIAFRRERVVRVNSVSQLL